MPEKKTALPLRLFSLLTTLALFWAVPRFFIGAPPLTLKIGLAEDRQSVKIDLSGSGASSYQVQINDGGKRSQLPVDYGVCLFPATGQSGEMPLEILASGRLGRTTHATTTLSWKRDKKSITDVDFTPIQTKWTWW